MIEIRIPWIPDESRERPDETSYYVLGAARTAGTAWRMAAGNYFLSDEEAKAIVLARHSGAYAFTDED